MPLFSSAMSVTLLDFPFWPDAEPVTPDLLWLRESLSDASRVTMLENLQIIRNIYVSNDKFKNTIQDGTWTIVKYVPSLSEVSDEILLSFVFMWRPEFVAPACCKCCLPVNKLFSIIALLSSNCRLKARVSS